MLLEYKKTLEFLWGWFRVAAAFLYIFALCLIAPFRAGGLPAIARLLFLVLRPRAPRSPPAAALLRGRLLITNTCRCVESSPPLPPSSLAALPALLGASSSLLPPVARRSGASRRAPAFPWLASSWLRRRPAGGEVGCRRCFCWDRRRLHSSGPFLVMALQERGGRYST